MQIVVWTVFRLGGAFLDRIVELSIWTDNVAADLSLRPYYRVRIFEYVALVSLSLTRTVQSRSSRVKKKFGYLDLGLGVFGRFAPREEDLCSH